MDEDDKLISINDLVDNKPFINTLWNDEHRIKKLNDDMKIIIEKKFEVYKNEVVEYAVQHIINLLGWYDLASFEKNIHNLLTKNNVPFGNKTKDKITGKLDYWTIKIFYNIEKEPFFNVNGLDYLRKSILLSKEFNYALNKFIHEKISTEVHFMFYYNTLDSRHRLNFEKFNKKDVDLLNNQGNTNPEHLIMFQFKKKTPEVYVGL